MEEIYIKTEILGKHLKEKYCKHKDIISIDELLYLLEDIDDELENLQEELKDFKQEVEDNYRPLTTREQIDYSENW